MYTDIQLTTPPTDPITTRTELKLHGHVDSAYEDDLFDSYLLAASQTIEEDTDRYFRPLVWTQYNSCFERDISLVKGGFNSIEVKYLDVSNTPVTVSNSNYFLVTRKPTIMFGHDYSFPVTKQVPNAVQIVMTWTTGDRMLAMAKDAVRMLALDRYRNREANTTLNQRPVPYGYQMVVDLMRRNVGI